MCSPTGDEGGSALLCGGLLSPSYALGLLFIFLVSVIWAGASVLVQFLYESASLDSPFLLTYVGVSLFTLWLPVHTAYEFCSSKAHHVDEGYERVGEPLEDENNGQQEQESLPEFEQLTPATEVASPKPKETWTREQHFMAAVYIAPVWFVANWTYNASLAYTSITSSTVLASTGSFFTFLFAVLARDESFTWLKLIGIALGMSGSVLTTLHDQSDSSATPTTFSNTTATSGETSSDVAGRMTESFWGDILAIVSAIGYGMYAVQTRLLCPHDESLYSMQLVLAYIGVLNLVVLSPIAIYHALFGGTRLTLVVLGFVVLKGLFDNALSDYLWLRAVILTNATVATVGLCLTIPLAVFSDIILGNSTEVISSQSLAGALFVLVGFVLVNIGGSCSSPATNDAIGEPNLDGPSIIIVDQIKTDQEQNSNEKGALDLDIEYR